jgi:hypothetical protein
MAANFIADKFKYRNKKILAHAKGQRCQMRIPGVCNNDSSTTVAAHSNLAAHGKGMGTKAHDIFVCESCSACHDAYDKRVRSNYSSEELQEFFRDGMHRTWVVLFKDGVIG